MCLISLMGASDAIGRARGLGIDLPIVDEPVWLEPAAFIW
jgi:hypothetical protein